MNTQQIKMKKILNDPKTVIVDTETDSTERSCIQVFSIRKWFFLKRWWKSPVSRMRT